LCSWIFLLRTIFVYSFVPQLSQNFAPSISFAPQFSQNCGVFFAPQFSQKRLLGFSCAPQLMQRVAAFCGTIYFCGSSFNIFATANSGDTKYQLGSLQ
jgi:hypothetical protein